MRCCRCALAHAVVLEQEAEEAAEGVEAVVGLWERPALGTVDDGGRHLFTAMGGEAVHEDRMGRCLRHDPFVDLEPLEGATPEVRFLLLPHRRPDVGVHGVGSPHGLGRVDR